MSEIGLGVDKLVEGAAEVYDDAFKSTAQESGKVLSLIPQTINAALAPLRQWIAKREYSVAETQKLLEKKLENVEPEKIVTPEGYVAVPALQAISYSMDSDELRNLYANLLARAMNSDYKNEVHPSFVELIKQMSPNDAKIFKLIFESPIRPVIDLFIRRKADGENRGGNTNLTPNITWIEEFSYEEVRVSLDNLMRLGLIEIPADVNYTYLTNYGLVTNTLHYEAIKKRLEQLGLGTVSDEKKLIRVTALANVFYRICITNVDSSTP